MSIFFADCFDIYGTDETLMVDGVYANVGSEVSLVTDPDGVSTQRCIMINEGTTTPSANAVVRKVFPSSKTTVGACFRWWVVTLPSQATEVPSITWQDASNNIVAKLSITTTGALAFEVVGGSTYTTTTPVITAAGWWHIEAKITFSTGGAGTVEVRVEGVEKLSETSLTFTDATTDQCQFLNDDSATGSGVNLYVKDFVLWDTSGSQNNDFLGAVHCLNMTPDGDSALNWSVSTGTTAYEILDNNPPLDDSGYIYADDTPPAAAKVTLSDLPADVSSVKALVSFVRAKKSDGGDGTLQVAFESSGADDLGADNPITTAYLYWVDVSELDPNTATAWTRTTANAALLQIDRTT